MLHSEIFFGTYVAMALRDDRLCHFNPKKVARLVAKRECYTLQSTFNLSDNTVVRQVARKIASCDTSLSFME